tara:strand:- start:82198 stop:83982 length:1785 start_codon:yes stop_codon:yes gene_type:complete
MVNENPFKELGGAKSADKLPSSEPFGRPFGALGTHIGQEYQPGELVMLSNGLYRVKAAEPMSMTLHMGLQATTQTGTTGTTLKLKLDETDDAFSSIASPRFFLPKGTKILLGEQGFNTETQVVTLAQKAEYCRATGLITVTGTATNGKILTIIGANEDGTTSSKAFLAAASEDLTTDPCKFKSSGTKYTVAHSIVNCINDESGGLGGALHKVHAELLLEEGANPIIRVIQDHTGTTGNTTITTNEANINVEGFTGGSSVANKTLTITTVETIQSRFEGEGHTATILFIPYASVDSRDSTILLNERSFSILESPDSRKIVYDLTWGISSHPKFIGADGDITNTGIFGVDSSDATTQIAPGALSGYIDNNGSGWSLDGAGAQTEGETTKTVGMANHGAGGYGYGIGTRYSGMTSPKIRVSQPRGQVRFTVDLMSGSNDSNKAGWITAEETPSYNPNPVYRLITGSGANGNLLPHFQLLQDIEEDLRDPRILITGFKYLFEEVTDGEVREMIRRSGRFNYKIVQNPGDMSMPSDGVTGPTEGWKALVESQRGRKMSFEEYKRATENVTSQTLNMLYGTSASGRTSGSADPRKRHRRI